MAVAAWRGGSAAAVSNSSASAWSTVGQLSESVPAGDYILAFSLQARINSAGARVRVRLWDGSAAVAGSEFEISSQELDAGSPPDFALAGRLLPYASPGGPVALAIQIQPSTNGVTATGANAYVTVFENKPSFLTDYKSDRTQATSTSFQTCCSVTLPAGTETWYVLGSGLADCGNTSHVNRHRLADGPASDRTANDLGWAARSTSERYPRTLGRKYATSGASRTVNYQVSGSGPSQDVGLREAFLLAMPASAFDAVFDIANPGTSGGTATSYTDVTDFSVSYTPSANPHLLIAAWNMRGSSTSISNLTQCVDDGAQVQAEHVQEPASTGTTVGYDALATGLRTPAPVGQTAKIQRRSETNSTTTTVRVDGTIFIFDLGAAGLQTLTPSGVASVAQTGAAELRPTISPQGMASAAGVGVCWLSTGGAALALEGAPGGEAHGLPRLQVQAAPQGVASGALVGAPTVSPEAAQLALTGHANAPVAGPLRLYLVLTPAGHAAGAGIGGPRLNLEARPAGAGSAAAFGALSLRLSLRPGGWGAASALGEPELLPGGAVLIGGLAAAGAVGRLALVRETWPRLPAPAGGWSPTAPTSGAWPPEPSEAPAWTLPSGPAPHPWPRLAATPKDWT